MEEVKKPNPGANEDMGCIMVRATGKEKQKNNEGPVAEMEPMEEEGEKGEGNTAEYTEGAST